MSKGERGDEEKEWQGEVARASSAELVFKSL